MKFKLSTMMGRDSVIEGRRVSGLKVRGYSSETTISLPPVYSRDFIPLERAHIPTSDTANGWSHLASIANKIPPLMDCGVGLLIGYDCSRALAPRQVITGGDCEPYGIRTDYGWSIVGGVSPSVNSKDATGLCNRISVRELPPASPAAAIKAMELDFKDTNPSEGSTSQKDIQFLQILERRIHQNEKECPQAANSIQNHFHVDNGIASLESVEAAIQLLAEAQAVCAKGQLRLHKFISNHQAVLQSVGASERAEDVMDVDLSHNDLPVRTVLGVQRNVKEDTFSFKASLDERPMTHRGILSTVASVHDRFGFLAPFLLLGKQVLQEMCQKGWDEPLPNELTPRWESWVSDLRNLERIQIPRCYRPESFGKI